MIDEESTTYKEPTKCILMCAMRPTTLLWDCCLVRLHHGCPDRDQMMGWHSHHIGNVILPFDEVRQISRWWNCTTNQIYVFVASQITFCFFGTTDPSMILTRVRALIIPIPRQGGVRQSRLRFFRSAASVGGPHGPWAERKKKASGVMEHEIFQVVYGS
jgi:hypothetical protein